MQLFLYILAVVLITGCNLSYDLTSVRNQKEIVHVDSSGITISGFKADEIAQASLAESFYNFSAIQEGANVKLIPHQNVTLIAGLVYRLLVSTSSAETVFTIKTELPQGAILAFHTSSCPSGWSPFDLAKGRVLVGAGAGNSDADGSALTTRVLGDTGGREFTTGIPFSSAIASEASPTPLLNLGNPQSAGRPFPLFTTAAADTTIHGPKEDSNMMPFTTVTYCQKD